MRDEDRTREQLLEELRALRSLLARPEKGCPPDRPGLPVERLPLACIRFDADNRVLDWNPAAEKMFGYSRGEVLGRVLFELILELPLDESLQGVLRRLRAGDMEAHSVNKNRTRDGTVIVCEWFNTPLTDAEGCYAGAISLAQDVTERRRVEEMLGENRRRFQAVFENALDAILLMDNRGRYVEGNPAACELLGYSREELVGLTVWDLTPAELHARIPELLGRFLAAGTLSGEYTLVCKGGGTCVVEFRSVANILPGLHLAIHRDIAERKRAEDALRVSEERFRNAFDHAPVGMYLTGLDGRWLKVNRALCQILGYGEGELLATTWKAITHPDDVEPDNAHVRRLLAGEAAYYHMEKRYFHKDGRLVWVLLGGSLVRDAQTRPLYFVGHVQDITGRKRAEDSLRDSSDRIQALSRRLLKTQEEERGHLARELHDEFGQVLATITMHLHAARGLAGEAARPRLDECAALLQQAGGQVRSLALELRPTMLDVLGLESALRWLAGQHRQRAGTQTQVVGHLAGPPPNPELAIACFRVAQEALTNVLRHAGARHVWIELSQGDTALELVVRDDGAGFDVLSVQEMAPARGHLGLLGMRERVQILGGRLEVDSEPGRGTRICASFPVNESPEGSAGPPE